MSTEGDNTSSTGRNNSPEQNSSKYKKSGVFVLKGLLASGVCLLASNEEIAAGCLDSVAKGLNRANGIDEDWDWDYQPKNRRWVCRNIATGEYAELSNCKYDSKNDDRWPN